MLAIPASSGRWFWGINNGLLSQNDPTSDRFFALFADNVHRHGTPALPKRYFDTLLRVFGNDCRMRP